MSTSPRIAVAPNGVRSFVVTAVQAGGGEVVPPDQAEGVVWTETTRPAALSELLEAHPNVGWVQLPFAGIEPYLDLIRSRTDLTWTCAKGVYAEPVAEHALTLALAGRRALDHYARAHTWTPPRGLNLLRAKVTIVGGGGIGQAFLRLIAPFRCEVTVVRSTPQEMDGVSRVLGNDDIDMAMTGAELVVLALPLLPSTEGLIDKRRLALLADGAGLVNVARGQHVVTDDLIPSLDDGPLGSVGLDVTDPEPLPDGHPLWARPDVIITPHIANTPEMAVPLLSARVRENVHRYAVGEPLLGLVDPAKGY
jgi:phosphoglycerate dehydrogenase-like enzyme